jgi:hypothetical protein
MANLERPKQRRGLVAIDGAMALIVILLIIQIRLPWKLSLQVTQGQFSRPRFSPGSYSSDAWLLTSL